MPYFSVKMDALRADAAKLNEISKKLNELGSHCDTIERTFDNQAAALETVKAAIKAASAQLQKRGSSVGELYRKLDQIANVYDRAERAILSSGDVSKADIKKLKDLIDGIIKNIKDVIDRITHGRDENTDAYAGDPVNMCNGNYIDSAYEFGFKNGLGLNFTRSYNSVWCNDRCAWNGLVSQL